MSGDDDNTVSLRNKELSKLSKEEWREFTKSVWYIANVSHRSHPAMFPSEIPTRLVKLFSFRGETVLDPFCGIGTAGVSSVLLGRKFVGVDTNSRYIRIARKRIKETGKDKMSTLRVGDSANLRFLKGSSVGLIVTSPPYWNKVDYGNARKNIGSIANYSDFLDSARVIFQECLRVLHPGRRMCVVTANVHQNTQEGLLTFPLAADYINICRNAGFLLVNEIIWVKDGTGGKWGSYGKQRPIFGSYPYPPNFLFKNVHEYILIFRKPPTRHNDKRLPRYRDLMA
jgi:site-specific DNA-methyltransferase (adenine-specific)